MCQATGPQARFPSRELVRGEVADGAVGTVGVVVVDPTGEHDPGLGERVELLAVEELVSCAGVERFDKAVLPRRAWVDVMKLRSSLELFLRPGLKAHDVRGYVMMTVKMEKILTEKLDWTHPKRAA